MVMRLVVFVLMFVTNDCLAEGERLDRSRLAPSFTADFSRPSAASYPETASSVWKTNYDFGVDQGPSSRTLPGEFQIYVDTRYAGFSPFRIEDGALKIQASRVVGASGQAKFQGKQYASGIMTTSRSFSQRFGYFEIKATLPMVRGAWPAFWLATPIDPKISAPQHGDEIDVVEALGQDATRYYCSLHWPGERSPNALVTPVRAAGMDSPHTYGVLWDPENITWYFDDVEVFKSKNPGMTKPMQMIINLAVGGWDNNVPPRDLPDMEMDVYFVRAYTIN